MTDDTISRAAALKELEDLNIASFYELNEHSKEAYTEVKAMLKALLPVDAVLVVRCKDCKYHHYQGKHPYCNRQIDYSFGWADDDFCSKAERRTNDSW